MSRALPVLFAIVAGAGFGQTPPPVKAGDPAPNLTFSKIIQTGSGLGGPRSLFGQTTVLLFLRPVTHNEQTVARWNKLVEQFATKPVNFVWITTEKEEKLDPFLKAHPVSGWMVLDPKEDSYRAYGIEGGDTVVIDSKGEIAGFSLWVPGEQEIQAVLDGRAISGLQAEPDRMPPPQPKPDLPPSEEVHISPSKETGTIANTGPDYWVERGFDLKAIVAMISGTDPSRVELPASLQAAMDNSSRYDFVLVLPREEDPETMYRRVREGIGKYFGVTIAKEIRPKDVYVMTAIEGKTPPPKSGNEAFGGGSVAFSSNWVDAALPKGTVPTQAALEEAAKQVMATMQLTAMTALSSSMDEFRRALEDGLNRPVIDETKLTGTYDLAVKGKARTTEEFLGELRDQLGLVLTPGTRSIEMTVVREAQ